MRKKNKYNCIISASLWTNQLILIETFDTNLEATGWFK